MKSLLQFVCCLTWCVFASPVPPATLLAQQPGSERRARTDEQPVFAASQAAVDARQRILQQVTLDKTTTQERPNVVLILADDLGYADTSTYGSNDIPTPHLDSLAASGVKFTDAYVTAASCSPSRAGLITGRYQQRFGFEFNTSGAAITHRLHRGLDPREVTVAEILDAAGYATAAIGKWHLGTQPQFHPFNRGFDRFYGFLAGAHSFFPADDPEPIHRTIMRGHTPLIEPEYLTDAIAREACEFIDQHASQPFFAYVPFNAVHTPIEATRQYKDRFAEVADERRRTYYAMVSALDDAVGRILRSIERHGLDERTLVIFLNDNGGPIYTGVQSNGPLKFGKLFLFEGGVRVPLIMRWPAELPAGKTYRGMTSSLDVFPTICSAAGIGLPESLAIDGVDLLPFITGDKQGQPHQTLFWSNGPNVAVRHGQWKLVKSGESSWLYDLSQDESEQHNLAGKHPRKVHELETLLRQWKSEMNPPAWPSKPNRRKIEVDGGTYELNI